MLLVTREWLEDLLDKRGRGARAELAGVLKLDPSAISRMLTYDRGISAEELWAIGRFFGLSASDLLHLTDADFDIEVARIPSPPVLPLTDAGIPVWGEVNASRWIDANEIDEPRVSRFFVAADLRYPKDSQGAFIVRGNSIEKVAKEGWALVCVTLDNIEPQDGDLVIAERTRDNGSMIERTAKRLRIYRNRVELVPEYLDPTLNKPLPLAAEEEGSNVRIKAVVVGIYNPLRR